MSDQADEHPEHPQPGQQPTPGGEPPAYGQPPVYGQPPAYGQQAPGGPPAYQPGQTQALAGSDERTWASAAHWSALVAGLLGAGIFCFAGPLVVMLTKGSTSPVVRRHAVESLNFQISVLIYSLVSLVLVLVLVGIFLLIGLAILWLVCTILGAIRASNGEDYRYPLTMRFVS